MPDAERIPAFRLARSGLLQREATKPAQAAASDFSRDAALLAPAARAEDVIREACGEAVESGARRPGSPHAARACGELAGRR